MIELIKQDEVHLIIRCEDGILRELYDFFTFEIPNARFHPLVKNKMWDGKISLIDYKKSRAYVGLATHIEQFAKDHQYPFTGLEKPKPATNIDEWLETGFLKPAFMVRDYQQNALELAINSERRLILSPTGSGKSLIIYLICMWHLQKSGYKDRILLVVPTTALVEQMEGDFLDYANSPNHTTHKIYSGKSKDTIADITITTWQSIVNMPKSFYSQFAVLIGDEAHEFKAKSLIKIMESTTSIKYRYGTTGTLDGIKTNKLVLEGLFGPTVKVTTTAELIDAGILSQLKIKAIILNYSDAFCKEMKKKTFDEEIDRLVTMNERNKLLKNFALSLSGNTLILFGRIAHGEELFELISKSTDRKVYLVYGATKVKDREAARKEVEFENDAIIIASFQTFSRGINIKRLHNIVTGHPIGKSRVRVLQSIGRILRKSDQKDVAVLYDIVDKIDHKSWENHTLRHFRKRFQFYSEEKFETNVFNHKVNQND